MEDIEVYNTKKLAGMIEGLGYEASYVDVDGYPNVEVKFAYYYDYQIDPVELLNFARELLEKIRDELPEGDLIYKELFATCFFDLNPGPEYSECFAGVHLFALHLHRVWS